MQVLSERLGVSVDEAYLVWNTCCAWTFIHWAQYRSIKTPEDEQDSRTWSGSSTRSLR